MTRLSFFPGLMAVSRAVVYCCSIFWLFGYIETGVITGIRFIPFLLFGLICWLLYRVFLRTPRSVPVIAAVGIGLWAAGSAVLLRTAVLPGFISILLSLAAVAAVVFRSAQLCMEPISAAQSISALERCTAFFIVFLWLQGAMDIPSVYALPLLAASLLSLVTILYLRLASGQDSSGRWVRGLIVVTALLLVIVAAMVLFFIYGADPLTRGILVLYGGLKLAAGRLWYWFCAFLDWLASLVSDSTPQEVPQGMTPPPAFEIPEEAESLSEEGYILLAVVGLCLGLVAIVRLLWSLRKVRLRGQHGLPNTTAVPPRRGALGRWLRRLWARITAAVRLRITLLSMRGTPQELYYFLTRAGRRLSLRKAPGETPAAFLRRITALSSIQADPPLREALEALESALIQTLYAPTPVSLPPQHAHCIRRRFTRSLWRARWAQLRALPAQLRQKSAEEAAAKQPVSKKKAQKNT